MRKILLLGIVLGSLSACMNSGGSMNGSMDTTSSMTNDNLDNPTDGMSNELETE